MKTPPLEGTILTIQKSYGVSASMTAKLREAIAGALEVAEERGYEKGYSEGGRGKITMSHARDLAETYHGGEGTHPLARHRDSMG